MFEAKSEQRLKCFHFFFAKTIKSGKRFENEINNLYGILEK